MHVDQGYGVFPGGDPRRFTPDMESCTEREYVAWRDACVAWDEGRGIDRGPGCATSGDGSVWDGTGFGIGSYEFDCDCDEGDCIHGIPVAAECDDCDEYTSAIFGAVSQ